MGYSKTGSKREVHSNTVLPQEIRKNQDKQTNFIPKGTTKKNK